MHVMFALREITRWTRYAMPEIQNGWDIYRKIWWIWYMWKKRQVFWNWQAPNATVVCRAWSTKKMNADLHASWVNTTQMPQCIVTTRGNKHSSTVRTVITVSSSIPVIPVSPVPFTPIECPICYDLILHKKKTIDLGCHQFCKSCINKWFANGGNTCPMCRKTPQ